MVLELFGMKNSAEKWKSVIFLGPTLSGSVKYKRHTLKGIILGCRFGENFNREPKRKMVGDLFSLLEKENKERRSGSKIQLYLAQKVVGTFALKLKRLHDVEALRKHFKQ